MNSTTPKSQSQSQSRIEKAKAQEYRASLFARLTAHSTDITHLGSVPNEGLESMLTSLDNARAAAAAAQKEAAEVKAAAPAAVSKEERARARRIERMLSPNCESEAFRLVWGIALDPGSNPETGRANLVAGARTMLAVLHAQGAIDLNQLLEEWA